VRESLVLTGGGPRGVIALEFLAIIQEMMEPVSYLTLPLRPVLIGLSKWLKVALVICMLFLRGVPIAQCIRLFDDLVLKLFDPS
jgi:hypothetical protein